MKEGWNRCESIDLHFLCSLTPQSTSQTSVYAQGAGLGASKPKDIGKYAEAQSSSYADKVQEAVSSSQATRQLRWNMLNPFF